MPPTVLVLGASARAAAASLRRAGLTPFAIDLFRDRDTELLADGFRCPPEEYPAGLFRLARKAPPGPWMYTGGLENYPELVGELAAVRELWGNGVDVLGAVRNPLWLADNVKPRKPRGDRPWAFPQALSPNSVVPETGRWLRKPLRGSGGHGVRPLAAGDRVPLDSYGQEWMEGDPASAIYLGGGNRTTFLGATRQLVGVPWLHAPRPFAWCGNVSLLFDPVEFAAFAPFGGEFGTATGIRMLFGIDMIRRADGVLFPVEVNPRYPASFECLEHSRRRTLFGGRVGSASDPPRSVGKAVYYAPFPVRVPASGPWDESLRHCTDVWRRPDFADIPHPGDRIEAGRPVCTLLVEAATPDACEAELRRRAAELDDFLEECRADAE